MPPSTTRSLHPRRAASFAPNTRTASPLAARTDVTGSIFLAAGSRDSGSHSVAATIAATTNGTFIKNTEPHQKCSSSAPPTIGPSGSPSAVAAAHTPMAFDRSSGGKTLGRIDIDSGVTSAAPAPIAARAAITSPTEPAKTPSSDAVPNSARPATISRLRPNRSPSSPAGTSAAANTTT
jgi:hypothetical protein